MNADERILRPLKIALSQKKSFPQYYALRAMGAVWPMGDQLQTGYAHATVAVREGLAHTEAAYHGAAVVFKFMIKEAGLRQVLDGGDKRIWRKPDPAFLENEFGVNTADLFKQTTFADPGEEMESNELTAEMQATFDEAIDGVSRIDGLAWDVAMLDVMYMVSRLGRAETADVLGIELELVNTRYRSFCTRVLRITKARNDGAMFTMW